MRSIIVHLRNVTEAEVAAFLTGRYLPLPDSSWAMLDGEDPILYVDFYRDMILYVDFYRDMNSEFEVEQWFALVEVLGGEPSVSVVADVSGRHPGDNSVREFACALLTAFDGVVQDDYTDHCWTRHEIEAGNLVEGCPFFNYGGQSSTMQRVAPGVC